MLRDFIVIIEQRVIANTAVASLEEGGGGGRPSRVTPPRHSDESKKLRLNYTKGTGETITWKAGRVWEGVVRMEGG